MNSIVTHNGMPTTADEGFILNPKPHNLTFLPDMPVTIAISAGFVQIDDELCFTHILLPLIAVDVVPIFDKAAHYTNYTITDGEW